MSIVESTGCDLVTKHFVMIKEKSIKIKWFWLNICCALGSVSHFSLWNRVTAIFICALLRLRGLTIFHQRPAINPWQTLSEASPNVQSHAKVQHWINAAVEIRQAFGYGQAHFDRVALFVHHLGEQQAVVRCPTHEKRTDQCGEDPERSRFTGETRPAYSDAREYVAAENNKEGQEKATWEANAVQGVFGRVVILWRFFYLQDFRK